MKLFVNVHINLFQIVNNESKAFFFSNQIWFLYIAFVLEKMFSINYLNPENKTKQKKTGQEREAVLQQ